MLPYRLPADIEREPAPAPDRWRGTFTELEEDDIFAVGLAQRPARDAPVEDRHVGYWVVTLMACAMTLLGVVYMLRR